MSSVDKQLTGNFGVFLACSNLWFLELPISNSAVWPCRDGVCASEFQLHLAHAVPRWQARGECGPARQLGVWLPAVIGALFTAVCRVRH